MVGPIKNIRFSAPFSSLDEHEVFAVQATRAQVAIRTGSSRAVLRISDRVISDRVIEAEPVNGVAVLWIEDLDPETSYVAKAEDRFGSALGELAFTTLPALTGPTSKFATISDVHLGADDFAHQSSMTDEGLSENVMSGAARTGGPFALRCAAAAISEAIAWGAELLLIKGDLVDSGATQEWDLAHQLLDDVQIPILATWGNHDVWESRDVEPQAMAESFGLDPGPIVTAELDNVLIVMADTSIPDRGRGDLDQHREAILEMVSVDKPVFLGIHHNIMRTPVPWFIPYGVSSSNAAPLIERLPDANRNVFISSGHTHRNRRHSLGAKGDITFTEVSATADYPGAWAGYEVSSDIIRQTVQRTALPEALEWSEHVRGALAGVWPRWAQGLLSDRSVDMRIR